MAEQGNYVGAIAVTVDQTRSETYRNILDAIERPDDEMCECPTEEVRQDGNLVRVSPRFKAQTITTPGGERNLIKSRQVRVHEREIKQCHEILRGLPKLAEWLGFRGYRSSAPKGRGRRLHVSRVTERDAHRVGKDAGVQGSRPSHARGRRSRQGRHRDDERRRGIRQPRDGPAASPRTPTPRTETSSMSTRASSTSARDFSGSPVNRSGFGPTRFCRCL